jgi:hypothetical protein
VHVETVLRFGSINTFNVAIFASVLLMSLAWYKLYVQPREQLLYETMDCMSEQGNVDPELAYNTCTKIMGSR